MEKRKTSIELMRFLAAVLVVLVHIRQRVYPDNSLAGSMLILAVILVFCFLMMTVGERIRGHRIKYAP